MAAQVKLTSMAKAAGCAAKLNPATLDAVLRNLPRQTDPNVLVGFDTNDDAGIYRIAEDMALVQTVDFFTPIVDDPFLFGQIAAANALSDVYAMGGRPISSLSIVGFPEKGDPAILEQIIRGGLAKMNEARCSAVLAMTTLNAPAAAALQEIDAKSAGKPSIHAVTDVTGFSLLGHAREMALGDAAHGIAAVSFEIDHAAFDYFPGAVEATREGHLSGGLKNNRAFVSDCAGFASSVAAQYQDLLFDPQTSGGLLVAIAPEAAETALAALQRHGVAARRVGSVVAKRSPLLAVS